MRTQMHKYNKAPIPDGENFIIEGCMKCGALRKRYRNGGMVYLGKRGQRTKSGKCGTPPVSISNQSAKKVVDTMNKILNSCPDDFSFFPRKPNPVVKEIIHRLTEPEARLKESLVMLNLAYRELPETAKSRPLICRFLKSQGYQELIKHLDQ